MTTALNVKTAKEGHIQPLMMSALAYNDAKIMPRNGKTFHHSKREKAFKLVLELINQYSRFR